jgi:hypothetical protein
METHHMKSVMRVVFLAGLALLALGGIAAASASAAECPGTVEGGGIALCSGGHEQKGTFAFTGQQQAGSFADPFNVTGFGTTVGCGTVKLSKGAFVAGAGGKLEVAGLYLEYPNCTVSSDEADCEVAGGLITVDGLEGKGTGPGLSAQLTSTSETDLLGGGTKSYWTFYRIKSKAGHTCGSTWEAKVRGNAKCGLPSSTVEAVTHILKCEYAKSEILNSGDAAGFELTAEIKLSSGKAWSLQKI